ncbi:hypothetical protein ACLKA6_014114 [Drosophila palustris]
MSQCSQKELQRQLVKLGWTIGQQKREHCASGEIIPMRLLSKVAQKEESPESDSNQSVDKMNNNMKSKQPEHRKS